MRNFLIAMSIFLNPVTTIAQVFELDLAGDNSNFLVTPNSQFTVVLVNKLPNARYAVNVSEIYSSVPFDISSLGLPKSTLRNNCETLLNNLLDTLDEVAFRNLLDNALSQNLDASCASRVQNMRNSSLYELPGSYALSPNMSLTVEVRRTLPSQTNAEPREWTFTLAAPTNREWVIHYGFSFLPDKNEEYFSAPLADGQGFQVNAANPTDGYVFEPTVAFSLVPTKHRDKPAIPKFTVGLGANVQRQLVFSGASWILGDNASIFFGIAVHKQTRLKGSYLENQVLSEALQSDQLVDETFDFGPILGIGFRFGDNPFSRQSESEDASE